MFVERLIVSEMVSDCPTTSVMTVFAACSTGRLMGVLCLVCCSVGGLGAAITIISASMMARRERILAPGISRFS